MPFRKNSQGTERSLGEKSGCFALDDGLDDKAYQEHRKGDCTVEQAVGIPGERCDGIPIGAQDDEVDVVRYGTDDRDADGSEHDCVQRADPLLGTPGIFGTFPFADEISDDQYGGKNTEGPTEGRRRGNLRCLSFQGRYIFRHPHDGAEACDGVAKRNEFLFVLVIQTDR